MKRPLLALLLCIFSFSFAFSQGNKDKAKMREELQQFKIDFLAKEMSLSEKEKSDFTPIYKEYDEARRSAGAEAWKFEREMKSKKSASDADYKKLSELQQKAREKDIELIRQYDEKFASILSAKQIYDLHKGEEKFLQKMKEMRKRPHDDKHHKPGQSPKDPNKHKDKNKHKEKKDGNIPCDDCRPDSKDL